MSEHVLKITREFAGVSPMQLYTAWTDPDLVAQWYGPESFSNSIHEFDARVGGRYWLTMHEPSGVKHPLRGVFRELEPGKKIVLTWQWEDEDTPDTMGHGETLVTVTFRSTPKGTEMIMLHEKFTSAEQVVSHNAGWSSSFNKLAAVAAGASN
jgi:uncharacterized protein YndB with AHSA1/START domain